jgi:hypothetical protein
MAGPHLALDHRDSDRLVHRSLFGTQEFNIKPGTSPSGMG